MYFNNKVYLKRIMQTNYDIKVDFEEKNCFCHPFWAAAPEGRCPVEYRGYFVRPSVCPYVRLSVCPYPPGSQARPSRPSGPPGPQARAPRPGTPGLAPRLGTPGHGPQDRASRLG